MIQEFRYKRARQDTQQRFKARYIQIQQRHRQELFYQYRVVDEWDNVMVMVVENGSGGGGRNAQW